MARSHPTSHLATLVIQSHVERWLYLKSFERDPPAARAYLSSREVQQEAQAIFDASLGSGTLDPCKTVVFARHAAAFFFWLIRDRERLARVMPLVGKSYAQTPWAWDEGTPALTVRRAARFARRGRG